MQAAAFLAHQRALDDQSRHGGDVAQLQQIRGDEEIPVVPLNLALQILNPRLRPFEPFAGADDPHVVPHEPPNFIPVVADDDQFVGIVRLAGLPGRNWSGAGRGERGE